jgi:hypothetical protein
VSSTTSTGTEQPTTARAEATTASRTSPPDFILKEIRLLLDNLTPPETESSFDVPSRANPSTIENTIHPPEATWTWVDAGARASQSVAEDDIGIYGLQIDIQRLFKLTSVAPVVWQPIRDFTVATWSWRNEQERLNQMVQPHDFGKVGYQADIDSYFKLTDATGPVWQPAPNPNASSPPFELSNGAADVDSFHDVYRLQIAFEDVWAELIDESIGTTAQAFYAKWDALMNAGMGSDDSTDQYSVQLDTLITSISYAKPMIQALPDLLAFGDLTAAPYRFNVLSQLTSSLLLVTQIQGQASAAFISAYGLNVQNIQAELQLAMSRFGALSAGADSKPITDPLDAALQIVAALKGALSQGAAARVAAFNAVPSYDIGGYEQLEKFLNDVRVILSLPPVTPKKTDVPQDAKDVVAALGRLVDTLEIQLNNFASNITTEFEDKDQPKTIADSSRSASAALYGTIDAVKYSIVSCRSVCPALTFALQSVSDASDHIAGEIKSLFDDTADDLNAGGSGNDSGSIFARFSSSSLNVTNGIIALSHAFTSLKQASDSLTPSDTPEGSTASDLTFPEVEALFNKLSDMLKERYRFDVFAPASINYGLLLNYRQQWKPQSYQVGNLAATIPLAPGETRRYTSKTVVKKSRNAKELDESLRSKKEDKSETQRVDKEIFDSANEKTDFKAGAAGSLKIGVYNVDADTHFGKDQGVDSKNTKRDLREAVLKAAQEFRNERRVEITTEASREDETTSYRELRNPNDELTVTYLFYELQRRYLVSESLHRATPVILVANDVPAPHEVDQAWLIRHDWILRRAILDDSFLPALEYLAKDYIAENTGLIILELAVQHQKSVVDKLSQQIMLANQALNAATAGVTQAEDANVNDQRNKEYGAFIKSFFDPLGVGQAGNSDNGTSNRARLEFSNEALQRVQAKAQDFTGQMTTELTALQVATDKYTAAATRHYGMLAEIDRLRLHVKDNIIHYMQAIWSHEPTDQRYFRLYNLDVPVFEHNTTVIAKPVAAQANATAMLAAADPMTTIVTVMFAKPTLSDDTKKLHQVADIDNLVGFKGNYMIFPLTDLDNYMVWYLMHNYIDFDDSTGPFLNDPDPYAGLEVDTLKTAMGNIQAKDPDSFAANADSFVEVMVRLLSDQAQQMVIVPSDQLYIEALPGTHPLLEDFKLRHRALDVKKVQAEVRRAELENLRLAARLATGEYGDPDIQKKIVIEGGGNPVINAD